MAQRHGGGAVRDPSLAGGVGGLGHRAQGRAFAGVFFMLTLIAYAAYARQPFTWRRWLAIAACYVLGLMAKPMLAGLPLLLLLLDYWPLGRLEPARGRGIRDVRQRHGACCWRNSRCWRWRRSPAA